MQRMSFGAALAACLLACTTASAQQRIEIIGNAPLAREATTAAWPTAQWCGGSQKIYKITQQQSWEAAFAKAKLLSGRGWVIKKNGTQALVLKHAKTGEYPMLILPFCHSHRTNYFSFSLVAIRRSLSDDGFTHYGYEYPTGLFLITAIAKDSFGHFVVSGYEVRRKRTYLFDQDQVIEEIQINYHVNFKNGSGQTTYLGFNNVQTDNWKPIEPFSLILDVDRAAGTMHLWGGTRSGVEIEHVATASLTKSIIAVGIWGVSTYPFDNNKDGILGFTFCARAGGTCY